MISLLFLCEATVTTYTNSNKEKHTYICMHIYKISATISGNKLQQVQIFSPQVK